MSGTKKQPGRRIRLAAISGDLAWGFRKTCSMARFDFDLATAYIEEYTNRLFSLMENAAQGGAQIILTPEYSRGSEAFTTSPENRRRLIEPADGPTSDRMRALSRRYGMTLCAAFDLDHGEHMHETAVMTGATGDIIAVQPKHPRQAPAPPDWPFNTGVRIYDTGSALVGITICSDCTYDPELPLAMARAGMEVMLLPACGFSGMDFVRVRARDTQCIVVYADDKYAAIVDSEGTVLTETDKAGEIVTADAAILPKKCSPDYQPP